MLGEDDGRVDRPQPCQSVSFLGWAESIVSDSGQTPECPEGSLDACRAHGECVMSKLNEEFWQYARETMISACDADTNKDRQALLDLANTWTLAALVARRGGLRRSNSSQLEPFCPHRVGSVTAPNPPRTPGVVWQEIARATVPPGRGLRSLHTNEVASAASAARPHSVGAESHGTAAPPPRPRERLCQRDYGGGMSAIIEEVLGEVTR
jgi:hypothetical protein